MSVVTLAFPGKVALELYCQIVDFDASAVVVEVVVVVVVVVAVEVVVVVVGIISVVFVVQKADVISKSNQLRPSFSSAILFVVDSPNGTPLVLVVNVVTLSVESVKIHE